MGQGECQEGENYKDIHPKMCRESLNTGKCPNSGRCYFGYLVKGTTLDSNSNKSENVWHRIRGNPSVTPPVSGDVNSSSFLEVLIRKEIKKLPSRARNQG